MNILKKKDYNIGKEYIISKILYISDDTYFIRQTIESTPKGEQLRKKMKLPPFRRNEETHAVSKAFANDFLIC